jgi:DNA-nicking Smr family endonuclease
LQPVSRNTKSAAKPAPNTTLSDFADLKRALGKAAKEAAARAEAEKAERARREAEERAREVDGALFRRTIGQVNGLPPADRVMPQTPRPLPVPASRQADEQAVLKSSLSDEFDVESLLDTDDTLSWRRPELGLDVVRKLRRGVWALQGELDMHGMRTDEARERLTQFLRESSRC